MAQTTSDSILGVIRKEFWILWRRCAGSDCFLVCLWN